jgi:type I restriction enzyme S subunit
VTGGWSVKALGDLFEISRGGSPRPIQDFLTEDVNGVNWIMISDASASGKYIERTAKRIRPEGVTRSRQVSPGDFLLTNSMSFGRPYIMKTDGCIHDGWLHLKKRDQSIDEDYFYHLLGSETTYAKFERLAAGATVKNLNIDLVSSVEVPVPPLPEQRRIATILDRVDSLRRKRQEAVRLADELLRAVFIGMFGGLDNASYPQVALADVVTLDAPMVEPTSDEFADMLHVGPDRIEKGNGQLLACETARAEGLTSKKFLFDERHVLYSKIRPALKKCALAEFRGLCSADMYPVRPSGNEVTREFIWGLLLSDAFDRYVSTLPDRANIPKLNRVELNAFQFRLPTIESQRKYSSIVQRTMALKRQHYTFLKQATALPASLGFFD